jgi:multidrug efflux pump subunit AcrA (membrane-fusion protein)
MPLVVTTGRAYRDNIEIVAGAIRTGTRVVVRGNEILKPNQLVLIADELRMDI